MRIRFIFVCSVIALTVFAAKPVRNWQTGTLLDSETSSVYLGTIISTSGGGSVSASTTSVGDYSHTKRFLFRRFANIQQARARPA